MISSISTKFQVVVVVNEDTWVAGGTDLDEQSEVASGSEVRSKNVNNSPDDTAGRSLPFKQEENVSLQAMLTRLTEDMVVPATAVEEEVVVGLRMSTQSEVEKVFGTQALAT